ncbi:hypothetical protein ACJZ2D_005454 [Fusarium nematophilum]
MAVNLEIDNASPSSYKAIFNVLKATLEYPASSQAKARKLADDIIFFCLSANDATPPFWDIWSVVIELASSIPLGHEWQDGLIESLNLLRQRAGSVSEKNEVRGACSTHLVLLQQQTNCISVKQLHLSKDLPDLSLSVAQRWNGLERTLRSHLFRPAANSPLDPSNSLLIEDEVLDKWKNFNSFLARLSSPEFAPWLSFPVWELQEALEEPLSREGPLTNCRVWVASRWIIRSGGILLKVMRDESRTAVSGPGKLCNDTSPRSIERWEFWMKRFFEIGADPSSLGLEPATAVKVEEALKAMKDLDK